MRVALLLGLVSVIAASSVACAVEQPTSSGSALRHTTHGTTGDDDDDDTTAAGTHDTDPTVGEHEVDKGNPNATTNPTAPATTGTASAKFGLTLASNTPTADLGGDVELDVNIAPTGAFNGAVSLAVEGLPAGATAAPATATLTGAATTVKVKISVGFNTPVTATGANVPLTITGTSGTLTATANANFKINPKVTLTIPMNVDALRAAGTNYRDDWGTAFGANPTTLLTQADNPIVVTVFNADSKSHIIHGANGFAHGDTANPIPANSFEQQNGANRVRSFKPGAKGIGYPHDGANGAGASFHLNVGSAP